MDGTISICGGAGGEIDAGHDFARQVRVFQVNSCIENGYAQTGIALSDVPGLRGFNRVHAPLSGEIWVVRFIERLGYRIRLRIDHFLLHAIGCQLSRALSRRNGYHLHPNSRNYIFKLAAGFLMHFIHNVCVYTHFELNKETFGRGIPTLAVISGDRRRQRCQAEQQA